MLNQYWVLNRKFRQRRCEKVLRKCWRKVSDGQYRHLFSYKKALGTGWEVRRKSMRNTRRNDWAETGSEILSLA